MSERIPLTEVAQGATVKVAEVPDGIGVQLRLKALGIRPGISITKVTGSFAYGPIVVRQGETQTALGRGICKKILVEKPQ